MPRGLTWAWAAWANIARDATFSSMHPGRACRYSAAPGRRHTTTARDTLYIQLMHLYIHCTDAFNSICTIYTIHKVYAQHHISIILIYPVRNVGWKQYLYFFFDVLFYLSLLFSYKRLYSDAFSVNLNEDEHFANLSAQRLGNCLMVVYME